MIERIQRLAEKSAQRKIVRGIGDDCAILQLQPGLQLLVTTDLCVEDTHFRREWHSARSVGHRCLARGLSDIAAMGGEPVASFLSLAVPPALSQKWMDEFLRGFLRLARRFKVPLAGGDSSSAPKITADIVLLGAAPAGEALLRSSARPGDHIYVTGDLGSSAAILKLFRARKKAPAGAARKHFYPVPRIEIGRWLRGKELASAMIDVSDGLSVDLAHVCQESGVSAVVESDAVPIAKGATLDLALHGGEDYELLFTTRPGTKLPPKIAGVSITMIGKIQAGPPGRFPVRIQDRFGHTKPLRQAGWQHFGKN